MYIYVYIYIYIYIYIDKCTYVYIYIYILKTHGEQGRPIHSFPHTYYVAPDASHIRVTGILLFADGPAPSRAPSAPPLQQNGTRCLSLLQGARKYLLGCIF